VGNDAPWGSIQDTYSINAPFNGNPIVGVGAAKRNQNLKPELSSSIETGVEMSMFNNRLGFDVAYYKTNTVDQIVPLSVSFATGYGSKYVNIGEVENSGIELMLRGTAVQTNDFSWDIVLNYSRNRNKVISLGDEIDNLQLAALQGGITINAREGEAYGAIQGTDYVYDDAGNKIIGSDGYYKRSSTSDNVIGNVQPDFNAGITNSFRYKNFTASFLVDMQWGGQIFSLDQWYGKATGLYSTTDFTNDLGNPVRNHISDGGGIVLPGVREDGNGSYVANDIRVRADNFRVFGYSRNPNAGFMYDASYVKLREMSIGYSLPASMLSKVALKGATFSIVGSNLWIIYKDLPDAD
ncbi:MAG: TonB-dependent receptor, partial [Chlamydiia bacterium]|nr:TonB-dependent receptor [Chlamydiia bacterium]